MNSPAAGQRNANWNLLLLAAWFGLAVGLLEGTGRFVLQELRWLHQNASLRSVSFEIISISPVFDLLLFGALALGLIALARAFPRLPIARLAVFLFSFLAFFDGLALTGRIRHLGVLALAIGLAVVFTRWFSRNQARALRFWRRTLPWVAAVAVLAVIGIPGGVWLQEWRAVARLPQAPKDSPNVLVIIVDTLRPDHLSANGYADRLTSPNLDHLAQQGVVFENAFAASGWSLPSHASLLTGRYLYEHGADPEPFDGRYPTLADALRARGYRTGAFSGNTWYFTRRMGFGQGFMHFEDYFHSISDMALRTLYGEKFSFFVLRRLGYEDLPARKRAKDVTRSVLNWIHRDPHKPFLAFLNYFDLHEPYLPPQPFRSKFSQLENPGGILNFLVGRVRPEMTAEQLQGEIDAYDGAIAYVDHHIGQLLADLDKHGLGENTLVVITSDHGEAFGEHGLFTHGKALYREMIQVPLIFWWPGRVPAGVRVATPPVTNAAIPATVMELVGMGEQAPFPGPSLTQLWQVPGAYPDWPYPLAEAAQSLSREAFQSPAYYGAMKSLVGPQWHYIVHEKFGEELYDWVKDPGEVSNLADTPEGQRIVSDFAAYLEGLLGQAQGGLGVPGEEQTR